MKPERTLLKFLYYLLLGSTIHFDLNGSNATTIKGKKAQ